MDAVLYFAVTSLLGLWAAFWVIRLGVRYGVSDALHRHRELTARPDGEPSVGHPTHHE